MKTPFELSYYPNHEGYVEFIRVISYKKIIFIRMLMLMFVLIVMGIIFKITNDTLSIVNIAFYGLLFLICIYTIFKTPIRVSDVHKIDQTMLITLKFDDKITLTHNNTTNDFSYEKFIKTLDLKHSYVIITDEKFAIPIYKNAFNGVGFNEFTKFIKEKCHI